MLKERGFLALLAMLIAALALVAAGCGGDDDDDEAAGGGTTAAETTDDGGDGGGGGVEALPSSSCTGIEYKGEGEPDVLIATDLPLQGSSRAQSLQMVKAIALHARPARTGRPATTTSRYQDCDDATAQAAKWDSGKCSQNAQAYAGNEKVIGVIGTFNSGCAAIIIPVLNQAPGGGDRDGLAGEHVRLPDRGRAARATSRTSTTRPARATTPASSPSDPNQGAARGRVAQEQGVKSVYILNDKEAYGLGVAKNVQNAVEAAGIKVAGFAAYEPKSANFEALFRKIKGTNADAVFVGGLIDENGGQLINDKVAVLGPNNGAVKLFLPDGFTQQSTIDEAGVENAQGHVLDRRRRPGRRAQGQGREFSRSSRTSSAASRSTRTRSSACRRADVVLDAIEQRRRRRAAVIEELFETKVEDGYIGGFEFNENGDSGAGRGGIVNFIVYRAEAS